MSNENHSSDHADTSSDASLQSEVESAIQDFDRGASGSEPSEHVHDQAHWAEGPSPSPGDGTLDQQTVESDMDTYDHYEMGSATSVGWQGLDEEYDEDLQRVNEARDRFATGLSSRQTQWDKKRIAGALCSQLQLTNYQKDGVVEAIEELDLNRFGNQGGIETVSLGLIRYVVNKERLERNPNATRISEQEQFQSLLEDYDIDMGDLRTVKRIAVEEMPGLGGGGSTPSRDPNLPQNSPQDRPDEWWDEHFERYYSELSDEEWKMVSDAFIENVSDRFMDQVPDSRLDS